MNAAISLFALPAQRRLFGTVLIGTLQECGLSHDENDLVNVALASLHSTSMSTLFSIAVVAEHSLRITAAILGRNGGLEAIVSEKCEQSFGVVASAADLVYLFHVPLADASSGKLGEGFQTEFEDRVQELSLIHI